MAEEELAGHTLTSVHQIDSWQGLHELDHPTQKCDRMNTIRGEAGDRIENESNKLQRPDATPCTLNLP